MDGFTTANQSSQETGVLNESATEDAFGTTTTTSVPYTSFPMYAAALHLWYICAPVIVLLGTFGNVMTIVIMRRMTSQDSTVNLYFTGTAVMDLVFLYTLTLKQWVRYAFGYRIDAVDGVVCKIHTWLYTAVGTISCWYLVCMTLHRALSVVWPHRVHVMCTRRTVVLLLAGVAAFFALLYSHALVGMERAPYKSAYTCTITSTDYGHFVNNVFAYVELALYCLLPFACLVSANCVLVWQLMVSVRKARRTLTQTASRQVLARERAANSVTLTVVVVSLAFLVLTLPTSVNFLQSFYVITFNKLSGSELAELWFVVTVRSLLGHCNAAVNFYLYCLTGSRFREEFLNVLCCGRTGPHSAGGGGGGGGGGGVAHSSSANPKGGSVGSDGMSLKVQSD